MHLRRALTAELTAAELAGVRALLDGAFDEPLEESDWTHALGGTHVLIDDHGDLIGHASVVERTLWYDDKPLRTGYVEAVAVRADRRGHGCGAALMGVVAAIVDEGYELGALGSTERAMSLYRRLGWQLWLGPTYVDTPQGRVPTPDEDGCIFVLGHSSLDITAALTCDWRDGDAW